MLRIINIWCASLREALAASEWSKLGEQQERLLSSLLFDQNPFLRRSGFLAAWHCVHEELSRVFDLPFRSVLTGK